MLTKLRWAWLVAALAVAVIGCVAAYVRVELVDPEAFAGRAVSALQSEEVGAVVAERVAVDVLERQSPDLVATRPLVVTAVEAVLETEAFERIARQAMATAHRVILEGDSDVAVELAQLRDVLVPALRSVSPELGRRVPEDLDTEIAAVRASEGATVVIRTANRARNLAWPALILGLLGLVGLVATAPDRRRALGAVGLGMAVAGAVAVLALGVLEDRFAAGAGRVGALSEDDARAAARAVWSAMAGDLERLLVAFAGVGLALWGSVLLVRLRLDRRATVQWVVEALAGGDLPTRARVLRGAGLAGLGAVFLLRLDPLFGVVAALLGAALVLIGLNEAVASLREAREPAAAPPGRRSRRAAVVAVAAVAALAAGVAVVAIVRPGGTPAPLTDAELVACNGLAELCDRRLDEVVLAGTHNSMSAADRPGWLFANQTRPIPRQLDDGIRLLMIDPHYGVVSRQGRIRTDLSAEGTTRNRVAAQLGADALEATESLAGRVGLVPDEGSRGVYLCHTLCELGAESLGTTLREIRGWLEANPAEVVVVMLESSVAEEEIEAAFEDAGLADYLAALDRSRPLPTLRELIVSGRRLIVLDDGDGGEPAWHQPAFLLAQDTSIKSFTADPVSCAPRKGTPDNPLLIANHWVDRFPPPAVAAQEVNRSEVLLARVERCRERLGRAPNAIAVDFYERGELIEVVRDLNASGAAAPAP
ncbi:MAG TPA: hypothetical protein VIL49_18150 [Capillimicrobium sp.]|jgi:hypothetical protein